MKCLIIDKIQVGVAGEAVVGSYSYRDEVKQDLNLKQMVKGIIFRLDCTPCLTLLTEMGSGFFSWLATRQDPAATRGGKAGETRRHSRDS